MAHMHPSKFKQMEVKLSHSNHKEVKNEGALAAAIGIKKLGKKAFFARAAAGRRRAAGK